MRRPCNVLGCRNLCNGRSLKEQLKAYAVNFKLRRFLGSRVEVFAFRFKGFRVRVRCEKLFIRPLKTKPYLRETLA